jgi:hypothetical protein
LLTLLLLLFGSVKGAVAAGANPTLLPVKPDKLLARRQDRVWLSRQGLKTIIHINRLHGIDSADLALPTVWLRRGGKLGLVFANFPFLEGLSLSWRGRKLTTSLGESPRGRLSSEKQSKEEEVTIRLVKRGRDILFDVPAEFFKGADFESAGKETILTVTWIDAYR